MTNMQQASSEVFVGKIHFYGKVYVSVIFGYIFIDHVILFQLFIGGKSYMGLFQMNFV